MAQNEWRLLTFEEDYSQYSYWTWTTSCNSLANYKKSISGKSLELASKRLSTPIKVNLFNTYSFYGLGIPYNKTNEFKCIYHEYKDPTSWLFKIGNEFLGKYFRILYANWTTYVYYFGRELHQPYSEILKMPMYELLLLFDFFQEDVKKQNEDNDNKQVSLDSEMSKMRNSMNTITSQMNLNNSQMSKVGDFKMPKF